MTSDELRKRFETYILVEFEKRLVLTDFESACLKEAVDNTLKHTEQNIPIVSSYPYPALMQHIFVRWKSHAKSLLSAFPEGQAETSMVLNTHVPVDRKSREKTVQLFDLLSSQFSK